MKTIEYNKKYEDQKHTKRFLDIPSESGSSAPESYDAATRSIGVIISSDNPIDEYDWRLDDLIPTVLIPEGIKIRNGQSTFNDSHDKSSILKTFGSVRDMKVETNADGVTMLTGRVYFADDPDSDNIHKKYRDKHLTNVSINALNREAVYLNEDDSFVIHGRTYTGRMKIITKSELIEISGVGIGADEITTTRSLEAGEEPQNEKKGNRPMKIMPEVTRSKLVSLGLSEEASNEEAYEFMATEEVQRALAAHVPAKKEEPKPAAKSEPKAKKPEPQPVEGEDAAATERSRIKAINELARQYGASDDELNRCIDESFTVERSLNLFMNNAAPKDPVKGSGKHIQVEQEGVKRFMSDVADGIILRSMGEGAFEQGKISNNAKAFRTVSLLEVTRQFAQLIGHDFNHSSYDAYEFINRAMSTPDFAILFQSVADKAMLADRRIKPEKWREFCGTGSVSNFKLQTEVRASQFDDLELIPEGGEYKYGSIEGEAETFRIFTYGKAFRITRQGIINDDVGAITRVPIKMRRACDRQLERLAFGLLTDNAALSDTIALFHANHNNVAVTNKTGVNTLSMNEMELLLADQTDMKGLESLDIEPGFLILPKELKQATEEFFGSKTYDSSAKDATRVNTYYGSDIKRIYSSLLSKTSKKAWYMLSNEEDYRPKMYFLNGMQIPYTQREESFNNDSISWKVRIDAGASINDYRGVAYNNGE